MEGQREILSAALSAHISELRLFWRETGISCRWLTPDAEHCFVDEEAIEHLRAFREGAEKAIVSPEVLSVWQAKASLLIDEEEASAVPFPLRTLTWLFRVVESPHREDLTIDSWNLYLWSIRLSDLPSRILQKLSSQLEGTDKKSLLDFDTLANKYYQARMPDFSVQAEDDYSQSLLNLVDRFDRLRRFKNLIFYGIANIGKANLSKELIANWKEQTGREIGLHCITVFHPKSSYSDLVERRLAAGSYNFRTEQKRPKVISLQKVTAPYFFESAQDRGIEDGLFVNLCREAAFHPEQDFLFIVECIERARIELVLGELSHMLDTYARVPWRMSSDPEERAWDLSAEGARSIRLGLSGREFFVPANVYFIGTALEQSLFTEENEILLQSFAFEHLKPYNKSQLLAQLLAGRSPAAIARLEEYVEHSVELWAEINGVLQSAGGEINTVGYGPLFSMCEEILQSSDVHEAAKIVLGTWRHRMLPPIIMKMSQMLKHGDSTHRQHLSTLMESLNHSWLRIRLSLEGLPGSETVQISYTDLSERSED